MGMKISAVATAILLAGMLAVYSTGSASAAQFTKDCQGTHQALQGGQCINLTHANPNRVRPDYYSSYYKRSKAKKSDSQNQQ